MEMKGAMVAGESSDQLAKDRAHTFRRNFRQRIEQAGISIDQLAAKSGVAAQTLRRWRRLGTARPNHDHLEAVARVLFVDDPWDFFVDTGRGIPADIQLDRVTNPVIEQLAAEQPDFFDGFSADDWNELASTHGVGGALTEEGVIKIVHKIKEKKELRKKFEVLLETHHAPMLAQLVEILFRDVSLV